MLKILKRYSTYTLVVALLISAISAYYSIVGLTAIFAAAVVPIIVMGAALELGKLVAAVWLKLNWSRAPLTYKIYLVPAVAFLMALTSMGIFGFLSKAHSDQSLVSGDSQAKIAIYDEKIKIARDNIDMNRKALKQMDEGVDQIMGRSTDENGAAKAVAIRKSQQKERGRLLAEIEAEQKKITALNEEAAPLKAENRKIEAEVGPIKYIAALIYGDSADTNVLEKAVRFVIIMIVAVFDPLALVLILAAQQSMRWEKEDEEREEEEGMKDVEDFFKRGREIARQLDREAAEQAANELVDPVEADPSSEVSGDNKADVEESILDKHPYLNKPFSHFEGLEPMVYKPEPEIKLEYNEDGTMKPLEGEAAYQLLKQVGIFDENDKLAPEYGGEEPPDDKETVDLIEKWDEELHQEIAKLEEKADAIIEPVKEVKTEIVTQNVTREIPLFDPQTTSHVNFDGKYTSLESLRMTNPEVILKTGERIPNSFKFGTDFPKEAYSGDLYMRVDNRPHRLFKFNGGEWIHVNKNMNTSYLQEEAYIQYLIDALNNNQYLPEMLTEAEDDEIRNYLENQ
jgi:hypothetical protein